MKYRLLKKHLMSSFGNVSCIVVALQVLVERDLGNIPLMPHGESSCQAGIFCAGREMRHPAGLRVVSTKNRPRIQEEER